MSDMRKLLAGLAVVGMLAVAAPAQASQASALPTVASVSPESSVLGQAVTFTAAGLHPTTAHRSYYFAARCVAVGANGLGYFASASENLYVTKDAPSTSWISPAAGSCQVKLYDTASPGQEVSYAFFTVS